MGTVFEAEDSRLGRRVALKIIAPGYVESPDAVERFRQEGRLASSLAHPRCVFVLEADEDDDGRPFIAMELMTGDTLQDLVEKGGPLPVGEAVAKILDVIEGLARGAPAGPDPPRRQALELLPRRRGPGQGRRLRALQVAGRLGPPDPDRLVPGHAALRLARADQGRAARRPDRRLLDGRDPLLPADRQGPVRPGRRRGDDGPDRLRPRPLGPSDPARGPLGARPRDPQGAGAGPRPPLRRPRPAPGRAPAVPAGPGPLGPDGPADRRRISFDSIVVMLPLALLQNGGRWRAAANIAANFLIVLAYFAIGDGFWGGSAGQAAPGDEGRRARRPRAGRSRSLDAPRAGLPRRWRTCPTR